MKPPHLSRAPLLLVLLPLVVWGTPAGAQHAGRGLQQQQLCPPLSKQVLEQKAHARNVVLISVMDKFAMRSFGRSWLASIRQAGISYAFVSALDVWTSKALSAAGAQCFTPPDVKHATGQSSGESAHPLLGPYTAQNHKRIRIFHPPFIHLLSNPSEDHFQSDHWFKTTWTKVRVVKAIHDLGFHVIHSDADVTWFRVREGWRA
jgi:hypothetical protein